jgi:hypothetical protein
MYAEQIRSAKVTANIFSGELKVLVFLVRHKYRCSKKTRGSKARTGSGYSFETFNSGVKYIGAAGALNMNVDEAWGDYSAPRVQYVIAGNGGFDLANLDNDAIFDENSSSLFILWGVEQSAIGYKKLSWHILCGSIAD